MTEKMIIESWGKSDGHYYSDDSKVLIYMNAPNTGKEVHVYIKKASANR